MKIRKKSMLEGAKSIGAGAAIGIGNVFSSLIHSVARNSSLAKQSFGYVVYAKKTLDSARNTGYCIASRIYTNKKYVFVAKSFQKLYLAWIILYISYSIFWMIGGLIEAVMPFLTSTPPPGLPPSSSGEPVALLIPTEREVETSSHFQEVPSVEQEEIWDAVDAQEAHDRERGRLLADRMIMKGKNPSTPHNAPILQKQIQFEKTLEKHLRRCNYAEKDIVRELPSIRHKLLYTKGGTLLRSKNELTKWIQDMDRNFIGSEPYQIIRAKITLFSKTELGK